MTITPDVVGIDVSKHHLDVFDAALGRGERIPNNPEAVTKLAARWAKADAFVLFEATGHYDLALRRALDAAGVRFARVNPARARDFARASGVLAKTDRVDARMLADMAQKLRPAADPKADPDREHLALLHKRRDQLVLIRKQERTRATECNDPGIAEGLADHIAWLSQKIAALEGEIAKLIKGSVMLAQKERRLRSVPGIGPVNAATLLALAPELGSRSEKQIAALAGLAPINRDSGSFRGKRSIGGGRKRLRDALYLAAVTASQSKTRLGRFYRALRDAGKAAKQALIALARKIIVILNAIIRHDVPFRAG